MAQQPLPVNTKSLLAHVFGTMQALANGEIDANTACAQAKLASQACNLLNYELKRSIVQMRLKQIGADISINNCEVREIESKPFRNTMSYEGEYVECQSDDGI